MDDELDGLLESQRILLITENISDEPLRDIRRRILRMTLTSQEPIKLLIDSDGGFCEAALEFVDFLLLLPVPLIGIVNGSCKSAAIIILQSCSQRLATVHSQFFLHFVFNMFGYSPEDIHLQERWKRNLIHSHEIKNMIWRFLSSRTGNSVQNIKRLAKRGELHQWCFSAEEAKKRGFIDDIILPGTYSLLQKSDKIS